jgi:hypothetical protein
MKYDIDILYQLVNKAIIATFKSVRFEKNDSIYIH